MALKPVLKVKVDELFMRWVTEPTTQVALRNGLQQILRGEPVSVNSPINNNYSSSRLTSKPQSPRPKSPSTPPCSPSAAKLVNTPLSPRRPSSKSGSKPNQETIKSTDKEVFPVYNYLFILYSFSDSYFLSLYSSQFYDTLYIYVMHVENFFGILKNRHLPSVPD